MTDIEIAREVELKKITDIKEEIKDVVLVNKIEMGRPDPIDYIKNGKFDIIINTVPNVIVNKEEMEAMKKDVLLIDQEDACIDLLNSINDLGPYGTGFNEPLLCIKNPKYSKKVLIKGMYPKFVFNEKFDAISFSFFHLI